MKLKLNVPIYKREQTPRYKREESDESKLLIKPIYFHGNKGNIIKIDTDNNKRKKIYSQREFQKLNFGEVLKRKFGKK